MPTYDYVCDACGHALEIFQSMSESPKKKCPACGKSKLARRIGAGAGFIFKGAGFYKTDYRSDSYKAGEKAETATGSTASAPDSTEKSADKSDAPDKGAPAAKDTSAKSESKPAESKPKKPN